MKPVILIDWENIYQVLLETTGNENDALDALEFLMKIEAIAGRKPSQAVAMYDRENK